MKSKKVKEKLEARRKAFDAMRDKEHVKRPGSMNPRKGG